VSDHEHYTREEAIEHFAFWAAASAYAEGTHEALADSSAPDLVEWHEERAAEYHHDEIHYMNCVRWLLGRRPLEPNP
jgi:hypothetical protein